jgi:hypothetical protein
MLTSTSFAAAPYSAPALLHSSASAPNRKSWVVIAMALVLVLVIFGSAAAFCWIVCSGRVSSCNTGGPFWARTVTAVCKP